MERSKCMCTNGIQEYTKFKLNRTIFAKALSLKYDTSLSRAFEYAPVITILSKEDLHSHFLFSRNRAFKITSSSVTHISNNVLNWRSICVATSFYITNFSGFVALFAFKSIPTISVKLVLFLTLAMLTVNILPK